jgi:uncharacterized protein (TIGR02588 family)
MKKNLLEWSVFGISLLMVFSLLGYLLYQMITHTPSPPNLVITHQVESHQHMQFTVHLFVFNNGGQTAENVQVEVMLYKTGQEKERATMSVGYVPKGSMVEGWVAFQTDPAAADSLVARVLGYNRP